MRIVAIGGGENGRTKILPDGTIKQYPFENTPINKKIIELSGKKNPNILILGTAGNDLPSYTDFLITHFQSLGANVSELRLINNPPTIDSIRKILDNTDIIYVGGGDTLLMINCWRRTGFDKLLKEYGDKGVILSGLSAGAICWFEYYDNDDYIKDETGKTNWEKLDFLPGLGFIKGFCVPHYDTKSESDRMYFNALLEKRGVTGYALDNCAAIIFDNGKISTITSQPNKNVYYLNPIQAKTQERY